MSRNSSQLNDVRISVNSDNLYLTNHISIYCCPIVISKKRNKSKENVTVQRSNNIRQSAANQTSNAFTIQMAEVLSKMARFFNEMSR